MELKKLIEIGSIAHIEYVDKEVVWEGNTFNVKIKSHSTPADFEYIYLAKGEDDSFAARRVHRFVLLGGGEKIPYEVAQTFKQSLLFALANAINDVQKDDVVVDEKKN